MRRYAAFLRGVSPMNAKMPALKAAFAAAGFVDVRTLLSSGNVVFSGPAASEARLQRQAEAAMAERLGHAFLTIVRPVDTAREMLASDPYQAFRLSPATKRIITFLRGKPKSRLALPIELDGARILLMRGGEIYNAYVPSPKEPVFMALIERTFGKEQTTRTWDTVAKVVH
jgi:uncharacterized protein (DUF1697 family)